MRAKHWFGICLSVFLLVCFSSSIQAQQKVIKIGAVYPLTGNIASTGLDNRRGVDLAVDIINGKYSLDLPLSLEEGLPNLGGAKIQIVYADTKGDPKNGMSEAERLITQEKVVAMIGAYQSSVTKDRQPGDGTPQDSLCLLRFLLADAYGERLQVLLPRKPP